MGDKTVYVVSLLDASCRSMTVHGRTLAPDVRHGVTALWIATRGVLSFVTRPREVDVPGLLLRVNVLVLRELARCLPRIAGTGPEEGTPAA